jgi:DNA polymerase (family X)
MSSDLESGGRGEGESEGAAPADRFAIAAALAEIGRLLAASDENPYRARAYERAARSIEALEEDLDRLGREGRLREIPGVGPSIAAVIEELRTTGHARMLDELRAEYGPGFVELSELPGLTPARIRALFHFLGVTSLEELREACAAQRVRTLRGFGARTEEKLLEAIEASSHLGRSERVLLLDARALAAPLVARLAALPATAAIEPVGSLRRWQESVGGIDLCAAAVEDTTAARGAILDALARFPTVTRVEAREERRLRVRLASGVSVTLHVVPRREWGHHLVALTGSRRHVERLGLAVAPREAATEEEVYARLGLPFIPPELREDEGELEAARAGDRFEDLLTVADIRGMTHCHTTHSDGKASVLEMAEAVGALGLEYLTITDHSPSAHYAGGVSPERLEAQWAEIAAAQEKVGVKILRGTESDITSDGALDYPGEILASLDVIIASIHARMKMSPDEMTARLVRAMRLPWFKIWGHGLGRLVLRRDPIACDVEAVLDAIAESPAAIELNGDPYRLDLPDRWARRARARGIRFIVSTDAHSVANLQNLVYGVSLARRAGIRRGEVLNTLPVGEFQAAVRPARG